MVVISRNEGESIRIGHDVVVSIKEISEDGSVLLAIEAPEDTRVEFQEFDASQPQAAAWQWRSLPASSTFTSAVGETGKHP
jgi:carbon storage regulator CsrA